MALTRPLITKLLAKEQSICSFTRWTFICKNKLSTSTESGSENKSGNDSNAFSLKFNQPDFESTQTPSLPENNSVNEEITIPFDADSIPWPQFSKKKNMSPKARAVYNLNEALKLVKESSNAKFEETVEVHVRLGIDPRRGDQMVRGVASLPHGTGKTVRVAVFGEGDALDQAKAAGADVVGSIDLVNIIKQSGGKLDFDKCIATPSFMPKLGQIARILGPRGLMPNPKVGTVTTNVAEAVKLAKRGRVDFKADKSGNVHAGVGKVRFSEESLHENIAAFAAALLSSKPLGLKKSSKFVGYFNGVSVSSTMGPGFTVSIPSIANAAEIFMKKNA